MLMAGIGLAQEEFMYHATIPEEQNKQRVRKTHKGEEVVETAEHEPPNSAAADSTSHGAQPAGASSIFRFWFPGNKNCLFLSI